MSFPLDKLIFIPLGGADEIGMNFNLFGYDNQWIIIDCGVTFHDRFGVEIITPDISYIKRNNLNIIACIATHAHEDHIGALPYLWPELRCPVYATPFTASIVRNKIAEKSWAHEFDLREVPLCSRFHVGSFDVEYITLTHSIPEPNALVVRTPQGIILHTGDWKIDPDPLVGEVTDIKRLIEIGDEGVLALVCDSTNVFCEGESGSEASVREEINKLIGEHPNKRITVSCFASNVARIETIAYAAKMHGRKLALVGRSLHKMVEAAMKNNYLPGVTNIIDARDIKNYKPHEILLMSTGSQGEPRSALARIASDQHPFVRMNADDVVIFSSRVIPGNERVISHMQNQLVRKGIEIITATERDIHVSGHPSRDDLRKMYGWIRPQIVVPVHGEARHLYAQADLARECGISKVVIPKNGAVVQLSKENPSVIDQVESGRMFWNINHLLSSNSIVFEDRRKLSTDGAIFITAYIYREEGGGSAAPPEITTVGLVEHGPERTHLLALITRAVSQALRIPRKRDSDRIPDIRGHIRRVMEQKFQKKPVIEVHLSRVARSRKNTA